MNEKEFERKIKEITTYLTNSIDTLISEEDWDFYCEVIEDVEDKLLELYKQCLNNNH